MKIQLKILALILIVVLLTGGVAILIGRSVATRIVKDEISDHLETTAQATSQNIQNLLYSRQQEVELLANTADMYLTFVLSGFAGMTRETAMPLSAAMLERMASSSPHVREAMYVYRDGTVEHSSSPERVGQHIGESVLFEEGQYATYMCETSGELTEDLVLAATSPVKTVSIDPEIDGVMVLLYEFQDLFEITAASAGMGDTGEVYIVNRDGLMITPSRFKPNNEVILKQEIDLGEDTVHTASPDRAGAAADRWEVVSAANYMGDEVLRLTHKVPDVDWTIVVEKGSAEVFQPVATLTRIMIWALLGILAVGAVLALAISRAISRPILKLHRGAEAIMDGNWDYHVATSARDEIGELSRAFDKMTANLKKSHEELKDYSERLEVKVEERTRELAAANEELNKEILERKQAQAAVERSESHFRSLIENASDVIVVLNEDGTVRYASPSAERLHGFSLDEIVGKSAFEMIHPDDASKAAQIFTEGSQKPGFTQSMELRVVPKDGSEQYIELTGKNLLHDPAVGGIVINYRDITERKRAADALRQSEEYFRALTENASDVIVVLNADGTVRYRSPSAQRLTGFTDDEVLGSGIAELIHPDDVEKAGQAFQEICEHPGRTNSLELRIRARDGTWPFVELTGKNLLEAPSVQGIVINYRDITERKRAADALRRSEEYFRALIENAPDMIVLVDADGTIKYASPSVQRMHGYAVSELFSANGLEMVHPDDLEGMTRAFGACFEKAGHSETMEIRVRPKEGDWRWIEFTSTNLVDDPSVEGIVVNYRDITERKKAEEALRQAHDELEIRVRERTRELARANEDLQSQISEREKAEEQLRTSLKEKEVLLKEIHHRVKNNLQVISSLLNLQSSSLDDDETRSMFKDSQNRVKSMALVHERLYQSDDLSKVDFSEYIKNLATYLFRSYKAVASGIELKIDADHALLGIDSAVPCGLIVNELLTNALKYAFPETNAGHGDAGNCEIRIRFSATADRQFTLTVSDNGVGLPEDFNVETTESLGLQLVHTLTEQLGGTVDVHSNGGAEFRIDFAEPAWGEGSR